MAKRIVLCFDGTWNTPDEGDADKISSETNVVRFHRSVVQGVAPDGVEQRSHYYKGVGTNWFERLTGGGFGVGVSRTMMQGYRDLSLEHADGDRIFVVGFSRGAYTARALVGMIGRCGLLQREVAARTGRPDDPRLPADDPMLLAYQYWRQRGHDEATRRQIQSAVDAFSAQNCRPARIAFLGVWDTVGALGIPGRVFQRFNEALVEFPDRDLSAIVERAYHAVAVDEHRTEYAATMWERRASAAQQVEQCWFPGDHCDVGGGHAIAPGDVRVADVPLAWMQDKASAAGLALTTKAPDLAACCGADCHDTYLHFLGGTWAARHPRYLRPVGRAGDARETVHESVLERRRMNPGYRPRNPGLPPV